MSVGATSGARGSFGVVDGPQLGTTKTRELVDESDLTADMKEALEADTFIIYGKASVEQYDEDDPPQKIEMKAFDNELDGFLDGGIISRRHKDIPVGDPLESYTLDEPSEVVVADEVLEFGEGDTLETGVHDNELWIVADLRNDSEIARETRLGAMTGDLNGFSVTVFCKEWEETPKGQEVSEIDWHSTTIGGDEHIKNKDSRFGVAEFKALFGSEKFPGLTGEKAERAATEILRELPSDMSAETGETDDKGFWDRVKDIVSQKADEADSEEGDPETGKASEEQSTPEDEKGEADGADADDGGEADEKAGEADTKSDADAVLERVKQELGDKEAQVLEKEMTGGDKPPADPGADEDEDEDEEGEPDSEAEEGELKAEEMAEQLVTAMQEKGFVTEEQLDERFKGHEPDVDQPDVDAKLEDALDERLPEGEVASKEDVESVMNAAEEVLTETLPEAQKAAAEDAAEQTAEKMATGETPDPSGGSATDEQDYKSDIQERFGSNGGN